jgi:hypothetical protein
VGIRQAKPRPVVVHAPTRRGFKGTRLIIEAVEKLRGTGGSFDFELIEGLSHGEFLQAMARADIVIDQVFTQSYGMAALECLAMGKVVLSGSGPRAHAYFPFMADSPVLDAPPNVGLLADALAATLDRRDEFESLAARGRSYVAKNHDHLAVAARFADLWGAQTSRARSSPLVIAVLCLA